MSRGLLSWARKRRTTRFQLRTWTEEPSPSGKTQFGPHSNLHHHHCIIFIIIIFKCSNGGVFGSLFGTPIINPPQSAILGMHGVFERPVVRNGQVDICLKFLDPHLLGVFLYRLTFSQLPFSVLCCQSFSLQVVIRPMMYIALTYDHRLVDGREAVTFLRTIKNAVEDPRIMLMDL